MRNSFGADNGDSTLTPMEQAEVDAINRASKTNMLTKIFGTVGDTVTDIFGITKQGSTPTPGTPGQTIIVPGGGGAPSAVPSWLIPAAIGGGLLLLFMKK